eukprot:9550364-Ditylum_brightwellii.AAC.1
MRLYPLDSHILHHVQASHLITLQVLVQDIKTRKKSEMGIATLLAGHVMAWEWELVMIFPCH